MEKTLRLALNNYAPVPHSLRASPAIDAAADSVRVSLASLYHHYYLDSFGRTPPSPDPALFEHVHFLLPTPDFRFQGSGLGISPAIKRSRSTELGQAFCRWFLHDHLNMTYFAHLESLLAQPLRRAFGQLRLERVAQGDTPDYLCAEDVTRVFLAEAKGRYSSVSFGNREFQDWRDQFNRVAVVDATGTRHRVKGHIVATRFSTESNSRVTSGIWAEDPETPGEQLLNDEFSAGLGNAVIAVHYSRVATKIGQPLLASGLASGVALPEQIRVLGIAWRVIAGPLEGRRFIGGYFSPDGAPATARDSNGRIVLERSDPLRLDRASATFVGLEESIFRQVVGLVRPNAEAAPRLSRFEQTDPFYSGFSVLRDGSVIGPIEFFSPEESVTL